MTATYDPDLIDRLVREARRVVGRLTGVVGEWAHRNLASMADQLEAARREAAGLHHRNKELGATNDSLNSHIEIAERERDAALAQVAELTIANDMRRAGIEAVTAERDAALAEVALKQGVIDSGNEAFRVAREEWRKERERLTARLALETAALESSCAVDVGQPITDAEAFDRAVHQIRAARTSLLVERDTALARVKELEAEAAAMRPVVVRAELFRDALSDENNDCLEEDRALWSAVDAYRARKP